MSTARINQGPTAIYAVYSASNSISSNISDLIDAAGDRRDRLMQYLVAATLAIRFPNHADAIRFRVSPNTKESIHQQAGIFFNDGAFFFFDRSDRHDFSDVVQYVDGRHTVYLFTSDEQRTALEQAIESHQKGLSRKVCIFAAEQFVVQLLYGMAKFDHDEALRQLRRLLAKYNELVTRYENDPSLKIVIPDFGVA